MFAEISQLVWIFLSKRQINLNIFSYFFDLLKIYDIYVSNDFKATNYVKNNCFISGETNLWTVYKVRFHFCAEYQFNFLALLIGHHYWSVQWPPGFTGFGSSIRRKLGVSLPVLLVSILISVCLSMLLKTFQTPSFIH